MDCSLPNSFIHGQECWSGLPFPSPGDLPNPGIELRCPTLQSDSTIWATREAWSEAYLPFIRYSLCVGCDAKYWLAKSYGKTQMNILANPILFHVFFWMYSKCILSDLHGFMGFPGGTSGKELACKCRRHETWVQSLGWEDLLEEGMATHTSILAWRIPMDRGAWQATVHAVTKTRTWLKRLSLCCTWIHVRVF